MWFKDNIMVADNDAWKSLDLMRHGCTARYGIGTEGTGADANHAAVKHGTVELVLIHQGWRLELIS